MQGHWFVSHVEMIHAGAEKVQVIYEPTAHLQTIYFPHSSLTGAAN